MGLFHFGFSLGSYYSFHGIALSHGRQSICIMVEGAEVFKGGSVAELILVLQLKKMHNEPRREKTGLRDFQPGPTQTGLCSHRAWLEA